MVGLRRTRAAERKRMYVVLALVLMFLIATIVCLYLCLLMKKETDRQTYEPVEEFDF